MRFPTNSTHVFLQISQNSIIYTTGISKNMQIPTKPLFIYIQKRKFPIKNLFQRSLSSVQEFQYSLAVIRGFVVCSMTVVFINIEFYRNAVLR